MPSGKGYAYRKRLMGLFLQTDITESMCCNIRLL